MSENENGNPGRAVELGHVQRGLYAVGRALLVVGVIACIIGAVGGPIERALTTDRGFVLLTLESIGYGLGAPLVGYGGALVVLARLGDVSRAVRDVESSIPLLTGGGRDV